MVAGFSESHRKKDIPDSRCRLHRGEEAINCLGLRHIYSTLVAFKLHLKRLPENFLLPFSLLTSEIMKVVLDMPWGELQSDKVKPEVTGLCKGVHVLYL